MTASIAMRPQYSVLFSNLNSTDASAIVEKLKAGKVDYQVAAGGSAIEVPSKNVYDLRLQMAGAGLPSGNTVGFEIFDKPSFGMTEFTQRLNYQRALQGELTKTIEDLDQVDQARVHLAIPERNLYSEQDKDSTASVVVKLKPGQQLHPEQVEAITHLVSAAVEGLKPEKVAVVDTEGNLLSETGSGGGVRVNATQMQAETDYEDQTAKDLQTMLDRIVGQGKSIVRVNARMNFDAKQTDSEIVEPVIGKNGIIVSESLSKEIYNGAPKLNPSSALAQRVSANAANTLANTAATGPGDNYDRTSNDIKYEVTKRTEHVMQAPGKIERLSVSVLLDGNVTPRQSGIIQQAVSAAIGLDATRGDVITVNSLPFDVASTKSDEQAMKEAAAQELRMNEIKWGAMTLITLAFLLLLRSALVRMRPLEPAPKGGPASFALEDAELAESTGNADALHIIAEANRPDSGLDLSSEDPAIPTRLTSRQAQEVANERPDEVARLIRNWMTEKD
jgi:flagellar M-ring protein FliF